MIGILVGYFRQVRGEFLLLFAGAALFVLPNSNRAVILVVWIRGTYLAVPSRPASQLRGRRGHEHSSTLAN